MPKDPAAVHVRLTTELNEDLARAAKANAVTLSEEIRNRLSASLKDQPRDPRTAGLLTAIARMANAIEMELPPWHQNGYSREALIAGIADYLRSVAPGEPKYERKPEAQTLFFKDGPAEQHAGTLALFGHGVRP